MISRRRFLSLINALGAAAIWPSAASCTAREKFPVSIVGSNAELGHRLRAMNFPKPLETIKTDVVIVGGGVAGLSAGRFLSKHGVDFQLFELDNIVGGNSRAGTNNITSYPWGAHYLPLPNDNDEELISFLTQEKVISGMHNGVPVFNEYYLCHDPKERLYINHMWQEGLIPHEGVPKDDRDQIQRFLEQMNSYREMKGIDGKQAFTIPLDNCSSDPALWELDKLTAIEFLNKHHYSSPYLRWYVNYCCADDFGTSITVTSAWAMIHYFASRKGKASNATSDAVLTWPEGNYWLVKQLSKNFESRIFTHRVVYDISIKNNAVECHFFDANQQVSKIITAEKIILATPQYINARILGDVTRNVNYSAFEYSPWMVANFTTDHSLSERRGELLSWDNVFYGSDSLGYVNAMHQQLHSVSTKKVLTYYKPLLADNVSQVRNTARQKSANDWRNEILSDLSKPHPGIEDHILDMSIWVWGHGMVRPKPGFISASNRLNAAAPIDNRIYFAHSDLSGISIFEEAFRRGYTAAKSALNT